MRNQLAALLTHAVCLTGAASIAAGQGGAVFVGDLGSVDRAVLDAADLSLPSLDSRSTSPPRQASPQQRTPQPAARAPQGQPMARPAMGMQPTTTDTAEPQRAGLFSRMKASWPFGKQAAEPAVDPFAAAQLDARKRAIQPRVAMRDAAVQPIPAYAADSGAAAVAPAAYQRRSAAAPPARQAQQPTSRNTQGLALRKPSGPRQGILSGLFGEGSDDAAMPAASTPARMQQQTSQWTDPSATVRTQAKPRTYGAAVASSQPQPKPTPKLGSAPRPKQVAARPAPAKTGLITNNVAAPMTRPVPGGDMVLVSDAEAKRAPSTKPLIISDRPAVIVPEKSAAIVQTSPKQSQPKPATLAKLPAPEPKRLAAPAKIEEPKAPLPYARTTRPAAKLPVVSTEPSERSRALLAEAHEVAATAATYEDFSAVVQRCRYVLAIDKSSQAIAYANQLAGWALTKRGDTLDADGRLDEARIDYTEALRADAECWRAEHALGVLAAREGDADAALKRFNRTIALNPEHAKAISNRAALAVQAGDYEGSLRDYAEAIAIDPDLGVAHAGRGRVCHMLGRMDEGLQHLDAAEMLLPEDAMIATGRGDLLTDLGRYGQAVAAYQRSIVLDPQSPTAYRNLAWMQATCPVESFRDGEAALRNAERAAELAAETDDLTLDTKAAALATLGRFDEAKQLQAEAIELAPAADADAYRERLAMYERSEAFTSRPVGVQQATYMK